MPVGFSQFWRRCSLTAAVQLGLVGGIKYLNLGYEHAIIDPFEALRR